MKRRLNIISVFLVLLVFFILGIRATVKDDADEKVKQKYYHELKTFQTHLMSLQQAVTLNKPADSLRLIFKKARISYKKVELFIEYYFPHYIYLINPPPIKMAEDHNPPQGLQVIEEQIFPDYDPANKTRLMGDLYKINSAVEALTGFEQFFIVDRNLPDALMEEMYRILTQGITGFDSPVSLQSIPEAASAISTVRETLELIQDRFTAEGKPGYQKSIGLLKEAEKYCQKNNDFDSFDRMHFIRQYLNPVTAWLGAEKLRLGIYDHTRTSKLPLTPGIYKYYSLFDQRLVSTRFFAGDSVIASPELVALGKKLFFDSLLAGNNQRSCATCHKPELAFTDGLPKSLALEEYKTVHRNAPTLLNSALQRDLFADQRQKVLEDLVTEVLANKEEMNSSVDEVAKKISMRADYETVYQKAYGDQQYSGKRIARAISAYVRSLISMNSRFDLYMRGHNDKLSRDEIKGFNLFMGKGKCGTCHFAPLFNGSKPPLYSFIEAEVIGVPESTDTIHPMLDPDRGRVEISQSPVHEFAFKTPTVRNIELTAPYMHNGVYKTLEEVIDFYNKGGGVGLGLNIPNQTLPFDKLSLTAPEKKSLVAFLRSLTDTSVLQDKY